MNRFLFVLVFLSISTSAFAQANLGLRGGINLCIKNGDKAKCESPDGNDKANPGYSFTVSPGYMFHPNVGINLDINFSSISAEGEKAPEITFVHVIPMLTGIVDLGGASISLGAGIGYCSLKVKQGPFSFEPSTFMAIKGAIAVLFPINPQLSAGLGTDFVYNGEMELCFQDKCSSGEVQSQLQVNLGMKYTF